MLCNFLEKHYQLLIITLLYLTSEKIENKTLWFNKQPAYSPEIFTDQLPQSRSPVLILKLLGPHTLQLWTKPRWFLNGGLPVTSWPVKNKQHVNKTTLEITEGDNCGRARAVCYSKCPREWTRVMKTVFYCCCMSSGCSAVDTWHCMVFVKYGTVK